ncbi:hypothetical protein Tco_1119482 [Tanacetum coccineum]
MGASSWCSIRRMVTCEEMRIYPGPRRGKFFSAPRTERRDSMATLYVRRSGRLSDQKKQNKVDDEEEVIDLSTEGWDGVAPLKSQQRSGIPL